MKINKVVYEVRKRLIESSVIDEELDISLMKIARFLSNHFSDIKTEELNEIGLYKNSILEDSKLKSMHNLVSNPDKEIISKKENADQNIEMDLEEFNY